MIDAFLSGFRILAEAMFLLRGWSLTIALVIFGFVFVALIGVVSSAVGGQAGVLTGLVIVLFVAASAVLARRSAKQRIVNNMARRDSISATLSVGLYSLKRSASAADNLVHG